MNAGTKPKMISKSRLLDDYYANLHVAYNAMQDAFRMRAQSGLTQDHLASKLGVDKGLISKRLNGVENLTLRTLSNMGTAMECRVNVSFEPYEQIGLSNFYVPTPSAIGPNEVTALAAGPIIENVNGP